VIDPITREPQRRRIMARREEKPILKPDIK